MKDENLGAPLPLVRLTDQQKKLYSECSADELKDRSAEKDTVIEQTPVYDLIEKHQWLLENSENTDE